MTNEKLNTLLARAETLKLFSKSIGGIVSEYETIVDELRKEYQSGMDELAAYKAYYPPPPGLASAKPDSSGPLDNNDVAKPPSEPPPEQAAAKALSPPKQHPALNNKEKLPFIKDTAIYPYAENEAIFFDIIRNSRSKAQLCRRLYEWEDRRFVLGKYSHCDKAEQINRFITSDNAKDRLNKDDFKTYWKPKRTKKK